MRFSVITVCFNNCDGLRRTRTSIVQQTCRDFEWLVIDGGSSDGTCDDLQNWRHDIAFAVSEKDDGIYDAMNKGIDHAQGEYLIFMNAGDVFASPAVLQQINDTVTAMPDADLLYGDAEEILSSGRVALKSARHHSKWWWGLWTHHQAIIYRRAAIGNRRYDLSHPTNADYKLTLQILKKAQNIVQLPMTVARCDKAGFSAARPAFARKMQRRARAVVMNLPALPNYSISFAQALSYTLRRTCPLIFNKLRFN